MKDRWWHLGYSVFLALLTVGLAACAVAGTPERAGEETGAKIAERGGA